MGHTVPLNGEAALAGRGRAASASIGTVSRSPCSVREAQGPSQGPSIRAQYLALVRYMRYLDACFSCIVHSSPKTCWCTTHLTRLFARLYARTHTHQQNDVDFGLPDTSLCSGLLWFTDPFEPLSQTRREKKTPPFLLPPPHHIIARYGTGAVQHSAAPCILSRPRSIRPLLLSLPPHSPTPLFFQRRFLPFAAVLPSWP